MNRLFVSFTVFCLSAVAASMGQTTQPAASVPEGTAPNTMDTKLSDASYGIGFNMGKQIAEAPFKLDIDRIIPIHLPGDNRKVTMAELYTAAGKEAKK